MSKYDKMIEENQRKSKEKIVLAQQAIALEEFHNNASGKAVQQNLKTINEQVRDFA